MFSRFVVFSGNLIDCSYALASGRGGAVEEVQAKLRLLARLMMSALKFRALTSKADQCFFMHLKKFDFETCIIQKAADTKLLLKIKTQNFSLEH